MLIQICKLKVKLNQKYIITTLVYKYDIILLSNNPIYGLVKKQEPY